MLEEVANIIEKLGNLAPQLAMVVIMVGLYVYMLRRDDKQQDRYDKKDTAFIETLAIIRADVRANWDVTKGIAESVNRTSEALNKLNCLKKHD